MTLLLCGDVMIGRGIDQVLPHPCDPTLFEVCVRDARDYVRLAERTSGAIAAPVSLDYVWGDAVAERARMGADAWIVNLETSITRDGVAWPQKAVHYRVSPDNAACLAAAGIDVCVLANNHILDWGAGGLSDTLAALRRLSISRAGAGGDEGEAQRPAVHDLGAKGRVLVFAVGSPSAGVPPEWAAGSGRAGVWVAAELSPAGARRIGGIILRARRPRDVVVLSIHWGPNWGFEITPEERRFAHALIDEAGVDVVHGHSSHHIRGVEIHRGRLILYGCGDFVSDYEGIGGYEAYRGDIGGMYFVELDVDTGRVERVQMTATRMRRFQVARAEPGSARWVQHVIAAAGGDFDPPVTASVEREERLELAWRRR